MGIGSLIAAAVVGNLWALELSAEIDGVTEREFLEEGLTLSECEARVAEHGRAAELLGGRLQCVAMG